MYLIKKKVKKAILPNPKREQSLSCKEPNYPNGS